MTVAEAITNCLGNTDINSVSQMTAETGLKFLRCLNKAVQQWYQVAPTIFREKTISHTISAPRTTTLTLTSGSTTVGVGSFTTAEFGQAVMISGEDDFPNRVDGTATLRHKASNTGSASATIYSDVLAFSDWTVERVIGDPVLLDTNRTLPRIARQGANLVVGSQYRRMDAWPSVNESTATSTRPETYDIEPLGHSRVESADAHMAVRFYPMPTEASTIELVVSLMPRRYGLLDLQDDTLELPVPDEMTDLTLLPIVEYEIARTKLFTGNPKLISEFREAALDALAHVKAQPSNWGKANLRIGTKPGF